MLVNDVQSWEMRKDIGCLGSSVGIPYTQLHGQGQGIDTSCAGDTFVKIGHSKIWCLIGQLFNFSHLGMSENGVYPQL